MDIEMEIFLIMEILLLKIFILEETSKAKYFLGTVNISYEILDGLVAGANLSYTNIDRFTYNFHKPFQARDVAEQGREWAFISEF